MLIVVTIIGVLAAIAVPAYSTYSTRSKIAMVANIMRAWQDSLLADYHRTGLVPATSTLGGVSISGTGTSTAVNFSPYITEASYIRICDSIGASGVCTSGGGRTAGIWTQLTLNNTNVGNLSGTTYFRAFAKIDSRGVITFYCANAVPSGGSIPAQFVPANCTCSNMGSIYGTGVVGAPC